MSNKCDFKYGEKIEFGDNEYFNASHTGRFLGYHPEEQNDNCFVDFDGDFWKYARRPLPNFKEGDPVVVKIGEFEKIRIFSHFNQFGHLEYYPDGVFKKDAPHTVPTEKYALLKNYNYGNRKE